MHCVEEPRIAAGPGVACIVLAGQPNVGKSVLFSRLTGRYVTVSNYPGTTVEVAQGRTTRGARSLVVLDAPGINSLQPLVEDERVTRRLLLGAPGPTVIQVGDAKNLARTLLLTIQFAELGVPLVLALNMVDEAEQRGVTIAWDRLAALLGVAVVPTVAIRGAGVETLKRRLDQARIPRLPVDYGPAIEGAIRRLGELLPADVPGRRGRALLLLAGDPELEAEYGTRPAVAAAIRQIRADAQAGLARPLAHVMNQRRWQAIDAALAAVFTRTAPGRRSWAERIGQWAVHPIVGWPILLAVLVAVYKLVGEFGAGTLVTLVQDQLFGHWITPTLAGLVDAALPWPLLHDFLFGEYGLIAVGLSYGLGIVLPIVSTFFLAFGLLEDSGYLPRLAVLVNRGCKVLGLNGKAVLPLLLGLGCVTMATMTTRILGTRKERLLATLLLALSIPCSAQLGVILAMVGWLSPGAVFVWIGVVLGVLLLVGWLAAQVIPGEPSDFILELPPLRRPQLDNIVLKTLARVEWYLKEVVPLFLGATALLFVLARTGVLRVIEHLAAPLVSGWLGLPPQTADVFLLGFLRRDYGAAGLFALARAGQLSPPQMLVSVVVITLFVPCVAAVLMMIKEQGLARALAIVGFVFPFAFLVGGLVHWVFGG